MKKNRHLEAAWFCLLLSGFYLLGMPGSSYAYHDGGVAYCEGCHTMHNSVNNQAVTTTAGAAQFNGHNYLLIGSDQGSTCLNCHATAGSSGPDGYHIATYPVPPNGQPPTQMTPGGDFAWLRKSYSWTTSYGAPGFSNGENHGHSIIAADYGFTADTTITKSPGGSYPASHLTCLSCHDPHGKYRIVGTSATIVTTSLGTAVLPICNSGSYGAQPTSTCAVGTYRLLAGIGYQPASLSGSYAFSYNSFFAVAPQTYNRAESLSDTRVAYGKDVSFWCANCHLDVHSAFGNNEHPTGQQLTSLQVSNYNAYLKSGNFTGTSATSYTSMVPFQTNASTNISQLALLTNSTAGPTTSDKVMCLTCHRAHASGWDSMTRWNMDSTFLTVAGAYPGTDAQGKGAYGEYAMGRTQAEIQATFYGRPASAYASYQRSLCNRCHLKD